VFKKGDRARTRTGTRMTMTITMTMTNGIRKEDQIPTGKI
jgi:hypothetical protein